MSEVYEQLTALVKKHTDDALWLLVEAAYNLGVEHGQSSSPEVATSQDTDRLNWMESHRATVYRGSSHKYFVVVDEMLEARKGCVQPKLRDAIDEARGKLAKRPAERRDAASRTEEKP